MTQLLARLPLGVLHASRYIDERLALMPLVGVVKRRDGVALVVPEREALVTLRALTDLRATRQRFWRGEPETPRAPHEAPRRMLVGPLLLAAAGFAFGVYPELVGHYLVEPAVAAIRATPVEVDLKLWHGINVPLAMSVATALLGLAFYAGHERLRRVARTTLARSCGLVSSRIAPRTCGSPDATDSFEASW